MKLAKPILAVLFSALMTAALFEVGLRLIGMGPPTTLNVFDPDLGWSKKQNVTLTRPTAEGFDVTFTFNAFGLRHGADVVPEKPKGTFRLLALGDSFTLGTMVQQEDLFLSRLEQRWSAEGRRIQVVNTGVEAYSTDQEVRWLEVHGPAWQPDLVLLFAYENDVYWNGQPDYTGLHKPRYEPDGSVEQRELVDTITRSWFDNTAIGRLLSAPPSAGVPAFQPGTVAIKREHAVLLNYPPDWMGDAVARTGGALAALANTARQLGARVLVVPIPAHSAIDAEYRARHEAQLGLAGVPWSPDRPVDMFLTLAAASGLNALDLRPALKARRHSEGELYFSTDWHLNPTGNRALADIMYEALDERHLVPPASR